MTNDYDCEGPGDDKEFNVNVTRGEGLLMATMLKRLRDTKKWTAQEAEAAAMKMVRYIKRIIPEVCTEIAQDCSMAYRSGASDEVLVAIADSSFALAGVRIADDLHKSKMAELN